MHSKPCATEWVEQMTNDGIAAIGLHGRSRQQRYRRPADWDYINKASQFNVPLIGNITEVVMGRLRSSFTCLHTKTAHSYIFLDIIGTQKIFMDDNLRAHKTWCFSKVPPKF